MHFKTISIAACLFCMSMLGFSQTPHPRFAIAGQPDSVYDYVLPRSSYGYSDTEEPFSFGYYSRHHIEGLPRFTMSSSGFYDNGSALEWTNVGGGQDALHGRYAEIASGNDCWNLGPKGFAPGDTIDARHPTWTTSSLELANPGGNNCFFDTTAPVIYFGVRYIFTTPGGNDTAYGYWGNAYIHMAMDSFPAAIVSVEKGTEISFETYPNPVGDRLQLRWTQNGKLQQVDVCDLTGRILLGAALPRGSNGFELDVAGLMPGVYLVRCLDSEGQAVTRRLLKE